MKKAPAFAGTFWWGKVDSNHRSRRQQIYSLPHLTALEFPHMKFGAGGRIRTPDLLITNQLLYQLSYTSSSNSRIYLTRWQGVCQQEFSAFPSFFSCRPWEGAFHLHTDQYASRGRRLYCTLCGREIPEGEGYWYCNGESVCGDCLPDYARAELSPYRQVRGREVAG